MIYFLIFLSEIIFLFFISRKLYKGLSSFAYKITKNKKWTIYIIAILFLPGTIVHELSHAIAALFLLVPFEKIEFIPEIEGERVKLGSVRIAKTDPIRDFLISSAPLLIGVILILSVFYFTFQADGEFSIWKTIISLYASFEIGNSMYLSKSDIKGTLGLLIFSVIILIIFYILGVEFSINNLTYFLKINFLLFVKKAIFFMLIPILIDLSIVKIFDVVNVKISRR